MTMRLAGFETGGGVMIGAVSPEGMIAPLCERERFWDDPAAALAQGVHGAAAPFASVRARPAMPMRAKVLCAGLNYRQHALETGQPIPKVPIIFGRFSSTLCVEGDETPLIEEKLDWECELGVVIGRRLFRANEAQARLGVFGYCAANDLSARTWQRQTAQWTLGKNADRSAPVSPIVTADAVGDPGDGLRLWTRVNGALMQDDSTADMIFSVSALIAHISQALTLLPGDLILTGTPSGVGAARQPPLFLKVGDRVEVGVDGVGSVANTIVAAADA